MNARSRDLAYGRQDIGEDDVAAVAAVLRGDWLTTGPAVGRFESALAERTRAQYAVVCANGTAALHLAAMALGLGPGDRVVVPATTFLATANAARYVGAEVVFADVDPETGLLTAETLAQALARHGNDRISAVFPVHLNGQCCAMEDIARIARGRGLKIVEDACHALGTTYTANGGETAHVGQCRHSDLAAFSFHAVKTVTMGEGGALTTNDRALAERIATLRSHGMVREPSRGPWYYEMPEIGYNYRATDLQCALGTSQLAKLDSFAAKRRTLAAAYDSALERFRPIVRPIRRVGDCTPVWHLYVVLVDFERARIDRPTVMRGLAEKGIRTQVHYIPVHTQPYYRRRYGELSLPGAERYYAKCLSLPLFTSMSLDDVAYVAEALGDVLGFAHASAASA